MKAQIFVSDGYPEAEDYDTNYVDYDPRSQTSEDDAKAEARRIIDAQSGESADGWPSALRMQLACPYPRQGGAMTCRTGRCRFLGGLLHFLHR